MKSIIIPPVNQSDMNLQAINNVNNDPIKRFQMISLSAYFRAEKRNFSDGSEVADWLESEMEIDSHLIAFSS